MFSCLLLVDKLLGWVWLSYCFIHLEVFGWLVCGFIAGVYTLVILLFSVVIYTGFIVMDYLLSVVSTHFPHHQQQEQYLKNLLYSSRSRSLYAA